MRLLREQDSGTFVVFDALPDSSPWSHYSQGRVFKVGDFVWNQIPGRDQLPHPPEPAQEAMEDLIIPQAEPPSP